MKKTTFFVHIFDISPCVFTQILSGRAHWHHHHIFSNISYFWGSKVRQKYALWVLIGCRIKFRIQRALPLEIWVKTQGDMSKIRTKKSFLWQICQFNHYSWLIFLKFYWFLNSNLSKALFLLSPILDSKLTLMHDFFYITCEFFHKIELAGFHG